MGRDMTVLCDNGLINIRVGAIIVKDGKFLMVGNKKSNYLYSVGGRIQFGETAQQAIIREVKEETGIEMEVDHLGFIHENYFYGDSSTNFGKLIYEISFYFYMKVSKNFELKCDSFTEDGRKEYLKWFFPNDEQKMYPEFLRKEVVNPKNYVQHIVTDER